jgi:Periplasmic copper-binding protein (NosD)
MTKTAFLLALAITALASMPAHAQQRVFVSAHGLDTNPCTATQPCRTFQHAHDITAANGEIDVIDPAGYGPLTITKGISIQAHGFGGITQTASCQTCAAITIAVTTSDPVSINGLLLDGAGTGTTGIYVTSGQSVQILYSVVRHFQFGISDQTSTNGASLLVEDTVASDNVETGIHVNPTGANLKVTLSRITANNNQFGVATADNNTTIANSVMSNNSNSGLLTGSPSNTWFAKNVISGNTTGVHAGGTVFSYGDNYINNNGTPVNGSLTPVMTQ